MTLEAADIVNHANRLGSMATLYREADFNDAISRLTYGNTSDADDAKFIAAVVAAMVELRKAQG